MDYMVGTGCKSKAIDLFAGLPSLGSPGLTDSGNGGGPLLTGGTRGPFGGRLGDSSVLTPSSTLSGSLLSGLLDVLGVAVEEHVNHGLPRLLAADGATETEDLASQEPVDETDGLLALVVGRDGHIDEAEGRIGIAEGDGGDVHVGSLLDGLVVSARVSDDDQAGLLEGLGDVIGEGTRSETSSNSLGTSEVGELVGSTLAIGTGRDDANISRVLNGGDDTGSKNNLLPDLADVDDVNTIGTALPDVVLHMLVAVLGADVAAGRQEHLDVGFGGLEGSGEVRHF